VTDTDTRCPVCRDLTRAIGQLRSPFSGRTYHLRQCPACWFSFVSNPWTDYARIYDDAYYAGEGADPFVDYRYEFDHPDLTVRRYEWQGIVSVVRALVPLTPATRWMDYGCGHGGLVRGLRAAGYGEVYGFDTGSMADTARRAGLPVVQEHELKALEGSFDVVTAIEVVEHLPDPLPVLRAMRRLLKPGGVLFLTTGNARPYRERILSWSYVVPDVHVSFFEPATLALALEQSGFRAEHRGHLPGFADIIRFKVLKTLRRRRASLAERLLPWRLIARVVDARFGVSAHPIGWAR